jgi:hypothetical protein
VIWLRGLIRALLLLFFDCILCRILPSEFASGSASSGVGEGKWLMISFLGLRKWDALL